MASFLVCFSLLTTPVLAQTREDILLADFEGPDYGKWKVTGTAFGPGPAKGTLPNQMPVSGYLGRGLVNSYYKGDGSTGTLTSPPFPIQRRYLNFLIGGGKYPGKTGIHLLIDGQVIRTATGPNDRPGGSEHLEWHSWDVGALAGKQAVITIIDEATGGWGHINIDHIIQSDQRRMSEPSRRAMVITHHYLHLPVKNGAPMRRLRFLHNDQTARECDIELADGEPSFWVFADVSAFKGQKLVLETKLPAESKVLERVRQSDELPQADSLYREKHRPQFHFTSRRGWLNDPNGLVYADGEYHLFYQHNPYGWNWGNMHWGHAVSKDLLHWREVGVAIYPKRHGDWVFSGSAVADTHNTGGFRKGKEEVLVAAFTSTGRGECIVYSNDRGRTWHEIANNPVVKHRGRDPRLLWHEGSKRWVMAVYDEEQGKTIAFYSSPNFKEWTFHSRIGAFYECPDLFALPVDGDATQRKWVLYAADGQYLIGHFDGQRFIKETGKHRLWHGNFYAAQTFSNTPDGRRIQIGWGQGILFPGMPFNQQMTIPCELTLRTTDEGVRMFAQPVKEVENIRERKYFHKDLMLKPGAKALPEIKEEFIDLRTELESQGAEEFGLKVRGVEVVYDVKKQVLSCRGQNVALRPIAGKVRLRVLVDRGSVEVFANDGRVALSVGVLLPAENQSVELFARGGVAKAHVWEVYGLSSVWR